MAREAFKVCPACQVRNRARREFCVKCGEALHDVEKVVPGADVSVPSFFGIGPATAFWGLGGILAVVVAFASGGWITGTLWPVAAPEDPVPSPVPPLSEPHPPGDAIELSPGAAEKLRGHELLLAGDASAGLAELQKAVAAAPEDAQIRNLYAHALWRTDEKERALIEFREATRLGDGRSLRLRADLANALAAAGRPDDAIRELETLAAGNPRSPGTYRELGQLYLEQGRRREAAEALVRATELAPRDADLQEQLGFVLEQSGRRDEALPAYRRAVELAPQDGAKAIRLAEVFSQEDPEQEVEVLREAVERIPEQPFLQQRLGIALEGAGHRKEAIAAYREYLRQAPDAPDADKVASRADYLEESSGGEGR